MRGRPSISGDKALIGRFMPKWEALLAKGGGPFFLGAKASFADVGVFEAIDCFQDLFGAAKLEEVAAGFPLLLHCCSRGRRRRAAPPGAAPPGTPPPRMGKAAAVS